MGSWKNHVHARLQQRDFREKHPFAGVFKSLSQLEEKFEIRKQILDEQCKSVEPVDSWKNTRLLQIQLRENEHLADKFAHPVLPERETRSCETSASTGIMLNKPLVPKALNPTCYSEWQTHQKSREYPFSCHDNKYSLKNNITVFSCGVGRRKCPNERRQNNSHFCLCQDGADSSAEVTSVHRKDFTSKGGAYVSNRIRRFPQNHKLRSEEAALEAREQFMWFGQDASGD